LYSRAFFVFGLSAFNPPSHLAVVVLPRACPDLVTLDWGTLSPLN